MGQRMAVVRDRSVQSVAETSFPDGGPIPIKIFVYDGLRVPSSIVEVLRSNENENRCHFHQVLLIESSPGAKLSRRRDHWVDAVDQKSWFHARREVENPGAAR
jgi:hypothetical protein